MAGTSWLSGPVRVALIATLLVTVAACSPTRRSEPAVAAPPPTPAPVPEVVTAPTPAPPVVRTDRLGRALDPSIRQVGLLVPLTGPGAEIGPALRNAAELALFDLGFANVQLMVRDTGGNAAGAAAAAQSAIDDGADLLLGPLFAGNVAAARPVAQSNGINLVSFSTDVTAAGGNAFVMGILPSEQVRRVVQYAAGQGSRSFAVIAPADAYGQTVIQAMRDSVRGVGGTLSQVVTFDPQASDYSAQVETMVAGGGFDTVMIPTSGLALRQIAPLFLFYGMRDVRLIGTGLWDTADIGREQSLRGGWFANPDPALRVNFEARYAQVYGSAPPRLATLSYDAVALAAALGQITDTYDRGILTDPNGFAGVDGIFRFRQDGQVQRGLAVLEVTADGPVVLDPAPQGFAAGAGS